MLFNTAVMQDLVTISSKTHDHYIPRAHFLSLARSKPRLCSANHRPGYWSNLPCDWPNTAWAYSEQETENGPGIPRIITAIPCVTRLIWCSSAHSYLSQNFKLYSFPQWYVKVMNGPRVCMCKVRMAYPCNTSYRSGESVAHSGL